MTANENNVTTPIELGPEYLVSDVAGLARLFPPANEFVTSKCLDYIHEHARIFIERSPFMLIGSQSADGHADVTPRGDPPGFVKVLDDNKTLLIPDRPGNNRIDTLKNIVTNPRVGLIFLIPGFDETMRVNGGAQLTVDPDLLKTMDIKGRVPKIAIAVQVDEVYIHCAKALRRSNLWDPSVQQDRSSFPTMAKVMLDHTDSGPVTPEEMKRIDDNMESFYRQTMY